MPYAEDTSRAHERTLVARAKAGDQHAFAALVEPHQTVLYTVCYRILGRQPDAEDACQLALLAAWQHLDRFEQRSAFSTWLYRIAHNAALGVLRRSVPEPIGDAAERLGADVRSHAEAIVEADAVRRALLQIPPDFRSALVLREYAGMSYREIAETLDVKPETVKTRIARARQAVAALLDIDRAGAR